MIYYRFSVSLTVGIASLGSIATDGFAIESKSRDLNFNRKNIVPFLVVQSQADTEKSELQSTSNNYESYVQAGYEAETSGNYQQAVEYYQKALELRPNNSRLKTSLRNVTSYAFDFYMQAGYVADRNHNYREALNNFRKALKLKPDSFHAQQAIRNITNYLVLENKKSALARANRDRSSPPSAIEDETDNDKWIESNKIWFFLGMGITSIISALLVINLFRSEQQKVAEQSESPSPETSNSQSPAPVAIAPKRESPIQPKTTNPTTTPPVNPEVMSDNFNSKTTQSYLHLPPPPPHTAVTSAKNHQRLKPKTNSIKPKPINQVTIVTSKTTKIDLIFELIKDLQQGDREVRRKAIWELAQKSDSRAIAPLIEIMSKVDSLERNLILEAITQITSRTLQPMNRLLLESLEDENPQVRKNAIRDLTRLYQLMSKVTKRLSQMTEDKDLEVQQTARWALQQLDRLPAAKQAMKEGRSKE